VCYHKISLTDINLLTRSSSLSPGQSSTDATVVSTEASTAPDATVVSSEASTAPAGTTPEVTTPEVTTPAGTTPAGTTPTGTTEGGAEMAYVNGFILTALCVAAMKL
jgi:hypothetical protein